MSRPKPCGECGAELEDRSVPCPLCGFQATQTSPKADQRKSMSPPADTDRYQRDLRKLRAELKRLRRVAS